MTAVTVKEAQAKLPELIGKLVSGEEFVITENDRPVARLVAEQAAAGPPRRPGSAKGKLVVVAEDDEHLADFKEYMP